MEFILFGRLKSVRTTFTSADSLNLRFYASKKVFFDKNVMTRVATFVPFLLEALVSRQFGGISSRETAIFGPPTL